MLKEKMEQIISEVEENLLSKYPTIVDEHDDSEEHRPHHHVYDVIQRLKRYTGDAQQIAIDLGDVMDAFNEGEITDLQAIALVTALVSFAK